MAKNSNIRATIAISLGAISHSEPAKLTAGGLSRYYLGLWLTQSINTGFPLGTLVVNISGCFFIGIITTLAADYSLLNPDLVLLITTGFLGAYTTFSSYELDTANLLEAKNLQNDLAYWIGTPLLGLLCFNLGVRLTNTK